MQLTEKEYQRNLLMIGRIQIFLPYSQDEEKAWVVDEAAIAREGQPVVTVKEELE
jgi:hypothetical protein